MSSLLFELVANELVNMVDLAIDEIAVKLEQPPNSDMGDIAFPCFSLAKVYKKAPNSIAAEIKEKLDSQNLSLFLKTEVVGGYLNFYLNKEEIYKKFYGKIVTNELVKCDNYKNKEILIEHTSVNPNASPHIGRARNAMIGDSIARLFRYLGSNVTVHYFVNDIGKQIALLACYTKDIPDINFNDLLKLYVAANEELKENHKLEEKVFDMLHQMENGNQTVFAEFSRVVDVCIKGQTAIFNEFGIFYDKFDYESQYVLSHRTDEILISLKKTGKLFEDEEGRLVLNLEEFNINSENPYLPLTRKDKTSLYPLRDVCYNIYKANENASRNIVVLGEDQRLYGRQINAVLGLLGYKGAELVNYSFVLLPEGKMSTRAGQVVLLEDLMKDTVLLAKKAIFEHHAESTDDVESEDIDKLAKQIAYGAIKYSILKCSNEKNVIFDKDKALNFQGDTSVYIQYSYARIQSLLRNQEFQVGENTLLSLKHPLEWEIVKKILTFDQVLDTITKDFNFSSLCGYLYELCQEFSRWYKECSFKESEGELKNARLFLVSVVSKILKDGLYILGVEAPDRV